MLGKLLKYDFKSMWKQFAIVWPAALALALITRLSLGFLVRADPENHVYYGVRGGQFATILAGVSTLVLVGVLFAMFVIALIFAIQRFYKGLLGDEGYLMHTLPARPWQLIMSKLLCAEAATVVSVLVAVASIVILLWGFVDYHIFGTNFWGLLRMLTERFGGGMWLYLAELLALALVSGIRTYLQIYAAISIGHLSQKNRVAMSFVAYVAINAILSFLGGLLGRIPFVGIRMNVTVGAVGGMDGPPAYFTAGNFHAAIWAQIGAALVLSAVFFLVTNYILSRRLNLE